MVVPANRCLQLLREAVASDATDLILCAGKPPQIRVDKRLTDAGDSPLSLQECKELCQQVMTPFQRERLDRDWEVDFSFDLEEGKSRFRANVFIQRGAVSGAFRRLPFDVRSFDDLGLPPILRDLSDRPNGLVLVTGPTGSGKSTTLAAMVDRINQTRSAHVITIEDPIEYIHQHKGCTIEQREVGSDTKSFHSALRSILRQNPDVVLLGEMRDPESIQAALTIAETGHLCLATLHTNSCAQTLARIVDVFPGEKQNQIRAQLAMALQGVVTQALLPRLGGGLQLALEIMTATSAIRSLIRENKLHSIDNQIHTGAKYGMQSMNQSLVQAVRAGFLSQDDAYMAALDKDDFERNMRGEP